MTSGNARRECPCQSESLNVRCVDQVQRAVARTSIIFGRHDPLAVIGLILNLTYASDSRQQKEPATSNAGIASRSQRPTENGFNNRILKHLYVNSLLGGPAISRVSPDHRPRYRFIDAI